MRENRNESLETTSAFNRPLQIGDFVVHTLTGRRGAVTAVEKIGGHETVSFKDGDILRRGIARQELRLANSERYV